MELKEYFQNKKGLGVLSTADEKGKKENGEGPAGQKTI